MFTTAHAQQLTSAPITQNALLNTSAT